MDCNGCTLCCYLLPVPGRSKRVCQDCRDCEKGVGCKDYDNRPPECVGFECMWRADELCAEDLRPDRIGVLFDKVTDTIVLGTMLEDGMQDQVPVVAQTRFFRSQGLSVVFHTPSSRARHIAPAPGDTTMRVLTALAVRGVA